MSDDKHKKIRAVVEILERTAPTSDRARKPMEYWVADLLADYDALRAERDALARAVREHNKALLDECLSKGTPAMTVCTDDPQNKPVCGACPLNYKIDMQEQSK